MDQAQSFRIVGLRFDSTAWRQTDFSALVCKRALPQAFLRKTQGRPGRLIPLTTAWRRKSLLACSRRVSVRRQGLPPDHTYPSKSRSGFSIGTLLSSPVCTGLFVWLCLYIRAKHLSL